MIKLERFQEILMEQIKHFKPEDDLRVCINRAGTFSIVAKNRSQDYQRTVYIKDTD